MEQAKSVEIRKIRNPWRKETWSSKVRELQVGESLEVPKDYGYRQSRYVSAKKAFPEARFSIQKQDDGTFKLFRVS